MTKSQTYYFVAKCLVLDESPDFKRTIIKLCNNGLVDWHEFIFVCSENLVLPLIYIKFRTHGILQYLPEEVEHHLFHIYELNAKRNTEILGQIKVITSILNEKNIFPLYLKGAGNLLDNIYSDIGERLMGDIDFLVHESEYLETAELMLKHGYKTDVDITSIEIMKADHYPRLYHPEYPADIEIHRIPTDYKCERWYNKQIVNSEKQTVADVAGCYVQSHTHKILLNFIHGQLSHEGYLYGWVSLKDIYDLYLLSKRIQLINVIPLIEERGKVVAYFAFARNAFEFDEQFFPQQNYRFKILKKKHDLRLNSTHFQYLTQKYKRFKSAYIYLIQTGFFSKKIYNLILRKFKVR